MKVVLMQLSTGTKTILDAVDPRTDYLASDQVNGDWATFETCQHEGGRYFDCQVFRHQISADQTDQIANPGLQQYAAAVSNDGTVYLVRTRNRSRWNCGSHAKLVRVPVSGTETVIGRTPEGSDALHTFALDETDGSTTLYLDRVSCTEFRSGIYRIANADTTT